MGHLVGSEGLSDFACGYFRQRDGASQLGQSIGDDEEILVYSRRADQLSEYFDTQ